MEQGWETVAARQERLREEFELFDEPRDKYEYIIDLGRQLPRLPEEQKIEDNRVRGCQSQVWLVADLDRETGRLKLTGDSDAFISKGLLALVIQLYGDLPPEEILANPPSVFEEIGLGRLITPGRSNGLYSVVDRVRRTAAGLTKAAHPAAAAS
jgi:cysteine desulfuration protein SufE